MVESNKHLKQCRFEGLKALDLSRLGLVFEVKPTTKNVNQVIPQIVLWPSTESMQMSVLTILLIGIKTISQSMAWYIIHPVISKMI